MLLDDDYTVECGVADVRIYVWRCDWHCPYATLGNRCLKLDLDIPTDMNGQKFPFFCPLPKEKKTHADIEKIGETGLKIGHHTLD